MLTRIHKMYKYFTLPLRVEELLVGVDPTAPFVLVAPIFSTFSKHLFKLKLWRTEFFQPAGAVRKYGKCSLRRNKFKY